IKEEKVVADAEIEAYQQQQWKAFHTSNTEFAKCGKYCRGGSSGGRDRVEVELKRFNDRALNRDLALLCAKVTQERPRLPDGGALLVRVQGTGILHLDAQESGWRETLVKLCQRHAQSRKEEWTR